MPKIRYRVTLTQEERDQLTRITTKGSHKSQTVLNALILLACDSGEFNEHPRTNEQITQALPVSMKKIDRVKKRFVEVGLDAALERRPAQRTYVKKTDGGFEAHLIALSCSEPPAGHARWSLRLLADKMVELAYVDSISYEAVRQVLKKTNSSLGRNSNG